MSITSQDQFGTYLLTSEVDLSKEVTERLIVNGSIAINIFYLSQLFLLSGATNLSLLVSTVCLIATLSVAIWLIKTRRQLKYILINTVTLAAIPIFIDQYVKTPWISYGLIIVILVLISVGIDNKALFIALLLSATSLQYVAAKIGLKGITDTKDLLLLNSYFSTLWVLTAGIGVYLARIMYLKYCQQIDEQLFELQDKFYEQSKFNSEINVKDHRNITLHGTVLNTLISYSNQSLLKKSTKDLANDLQEDIKKIHFYEKSSKSATPLLNLLSEGLNTLGLKINLVVEKELVIAQKDSNSILEIIREIILNTKKHTNSDQITISVTENANGLKVVIEEILKSQISYSAMTEKIAAASSSKTLARLTLPVGIDLNIKSSPELNKLTYAFEISGSQKPQQILQNISKLRGVSLSKNIELLTLVSIFYSVLAIVGFFLVNVPGYILATLLVAHILLTIELFSKNKRIWRPGSALILLLTLIPYVIASGSECENLLYTPWLFNAIFGCVLYGIAVLKNPILKSLPAVIFIVENYAARFAFPEQCKTLLDGSTPGFLFILLFGYSLAKLRTRNIKVDSDLRISLENQIEYSKIVADSIQVERNKIIGELKLFVEKIASSPDLTQQLKSEISIFIQKIRVFLICSEFYSSTFIQNLYKFGIDRLSKGSAFKISIYASQINDNYAFDLNLLEELNSASLGKSVEIIISEGEMMTLQYLVDGEELVQFNLSN